MNMLFGQGLWDVSLVSYDTYSLGVFSINFRIIDPFRKKIPLGYKRDFCSYSNDTLCISRYGGFF